MSVSTQTIEAVIEAVSEFALLDHLLTTRPTATALERYLEFQAYVELVHLASAEDTLPSNHGLRTIPISEIEN
jgi:hypothetical protein